MGWFSLSPMLTGPLNKLRVDARNTLNDLLLSTDVKILKSAELRYKKLRGGYAIRHYR